MTLFYQSQHHVKATEATPRSDGITMPKHVATIRTPTSSLALGKEGPIIGTDSVLVLRCLLGRPLYQLLSFLACEYAEREALVFFYRIVCSSPPSLRTKHPAVVLIEDHNETLIGSSALAPCRKRCRLLKLKSKSDHPNWHKVLCGSCLVVEV